MKVVKWLLVVAGMAVAALAVFLGYMGMFSKLEVTEKKIGPYVYAYQEFTGPYEKTMPVFAEVANLLAAQGIQGDNGIGVYFDSPSNTAPEKLRSNCGSIIDEKDAAKAAKIPKLKVGHIPESAAVVAEFPIKNDLSYMIGPMKAYPAITKYMDSKGYPMMQAFEIYDIRGKKTVYFVPIENAKP